MNINRYDEYGIPAAGNSGRFQYTGQTGPAKKSDPALASCAPNILITKSIWKHLARRAAITSILGSSQNGQNCDRREVA
jgi:hypothetical protein